MNQSIVKQTKLLNHQLSKQDFDLEFWKGIPTSAMLEGGRGASIKIKIDGCYWVLRRYLRGGLIKKFFHDQYLWTGYHQSRPVQESHAVNLALSHNLPVPLIAGFLVSRDGLFYRAAIISKYIKNQGTLADIMGRQALSERDWMRLGFIIRRLHNAGLNHTDLNANNILIDFSMGFHIIDFDQAKTHKKQGVWGKRNLQRLLRSLKKIKSARQKSNLFFHFGRKDWINLLNGYEQRVEIKD